MPMDSGNPHSGVPDPHGHDRQRHSLASTSANSGASSSIRRRAISAYSGLISIRIASRPKRSATSPTVAAPPNRSSTVARDGSRVDVTRRWAPSRRVSSDCVPILLELPRQDLVRDFPIDASPNHRLCGLPVASRLTSFARSPSPTVAPHSGSQAPRSLVPALMHGSTSLGGNVSEVDPPGNDPGDLPDVAEVGAGPIGPRPYAPLGFTVDVESGCTVNTRPPVPPCSDPALTRTASAS